MSYNYQVHGNDSNLSHKKIIILVANIYLQLTSNLVLNKQDYTQNTHTHCLIILQGLQGTKHPSMLALNNKTVVTNTSYKHFTHPNVYVVQLGN